MKDKFTQTVWDDPSCKHENCGLKFLSGDLHGGSMLQAGPSTSPMAVAPTTPKPDRCRNEIIDDEVRPAEFEEWETQTERLKHHLEHQMNTAIADKKL